MDQHTLDCFNAYHMILKAEQDETAGLLKEMGYWSPEYLSRQISRAMDWKIEMIKRQLDLIEDMIREWEKGWRPPMVVPAEGIYSAQLAKADWEWDKLNDDQKEDYRRNLNKYLTDEGIYDLVDSEFGQEYAQGMWDYVSGSTSVTMAKHIMQALNPTTPIGSQWGKYSLDFLSRGRDQVADMTAKMVLTDADRAAKAIMDSLESGQGVYDAIKNLKQNPDFTAARARTFAVTEVLTAYSQGQNVAIMDSDVVTHKEWLHTGSHKNQPRPAHVALSGTIIPKEEKFSVNGHSADYPRDPSLPASERVNCHCAVNPSLGEDDGWGDLDEYLDQARAEVEEELSTPEALAQTEADIWTRSKYAKEHPDAVPPSMRDFIENDPIDDMTASTEVNSFFDDYKDVVKNLSVMAEERGGIQYLRSTESKHKIAYEDYKAMTGSHDYKWSDEIASSLRNYTDVTYATINKALRNGTSEYWSPAVDRDFLNIMEAFEQTKLKYNVSLFRGSDHISIKDLKIGSVINEAGFLSTSVKEQLAFDFVVDADDDHRIIFVYDTKAGTPAIPVAPLSRYESELEVILNGGQHVITDIKQQEFDDAPVYYVYLTQK